VPVHSWSAGAVKTTGSGSGASIERRTFDADVLDPAVIRAALLDALWCWGERLRRRGQITGALTLHVSFADASSVVRTRQLPQPSGHTDDLRGPEYRIFDALGLQRARVRGITARRPAGSLRPVGGRADQPAGRHLRAWPAHGVAAGRRGRR
jgi:DNA polymerase-4